MSEKTWELYGGGVITGCCAVENLDTPIFREAVHANNERIREAYQKVAS